MATEIARARMLHASTATFRIASMPTTPLGWRITVAGQTDRMQRRYSVDRSIICLRAL